MLWFPPRGVQTKQNMFWEMLNTETVKKMFVLQFGVELAVALDVLCYMFGFFFLSWDVSLLPLLKKNNVLYVAIYCLCDWNVVFYSFSRPTFNGGLPIVAQLALVKGAAAFLFCFVCFVFFRHEAQRFRLLVINSGWPKEYSHFTHCSNPFL